MLLSYSKNILIKIAKHPWLAHYFLRFVLQLHNISYKAAGILSAELEPDKLHPKHRILEYHDWFVSRLKKDWNVLDIGCGNGALTKDIKLGCKTVTGVDINMDNIEKAKEMFSGEGITYICTDALNFQYETRFHAFVLSNVLEHIENRVDFLKGIYAYQNKNDPPVLLLRVPLLTRDWITLYKKEKGTEWRLDKTHFTEYTLEQVFDELNQAGLTVDSYEVKFGEFYGVVKKRDKKD